MAYTPRSREELRRGTIDKDSKTGVGYTTMIQLIPMSGIPICNRRSLKKTHFNLSKALTRESLISKTLAFLVLMECNISCVIPIGSVIWRSFKKPYRWQDMDLLSMGLRRRVAILEIILYTKLHKEIG